MTEKTTTKKQQIEFEFFNGMKCQSQKNSKIFWKITYGIFNDLTCNNARTVKYINV